MLTLDQVQEYLESQGCTDFERPLPNQLTCIVPAGELAYYTVHADGTLSEELLGEGRAFRMTFEELKENWEENCD